MNGACRSLSLECGAGNAMAGIEVEWERVPANEDDALEPAIDEVDRCEYSIDDFEVEDRTASAGPDL